ncbi:MAG: hypothetical protein WDO71_26675 [Bacteroidota bacterium]
MRRIAEKINTVPVAAIGHQVDRFAETTGFCIRCNKLKDTGKPFLVAVISRVNATSWLVFGEYKAGLILVLLKSYKKCNTAPDHVFMTLG